MIPDEALELIKEFEGCELNAYRCPANVWTLGYGSTRINGRAVREGDRLNSNEEAEALLFYQLEAEFLPKLKIIPGWGEMTDYQRSSLISFAWNLGAHFYGSVGFETITKHLKEKQWTLVPDALKLYTFAGGQKLEGLVRRRESEARLWEQGLNLIENEGKPIPEPIQEASMIAKVYLVTELPEALAREVQTFLKSLGYYNGDIDGIPGKNTAEAWASWKADRWLGQTANIGPSSFEQLRKEAQDDPSIDWTRFSSKVSKYFTVGEVALFQGDRLPTNKQHQDNAIRLAKELDKVREWWGSGLRVTSWYRPPHVERAVGGSFHTHPFGLAADIAPVQGSVWDMQARFQGEWYNTGKWKGGFGRGAKKGFLHLDLKNRRDWNY